MIIYQVAMILAIISESVGTAALSDYVDQQDGISTRSGGRAMVHNNSFIGIASYNIFVGIYVSTILGSGFFFDLFWPERTETRSVRLAWKICAVLACAMIFADALALTVIVARNHAYITGVSAELAQTLYNNNKTPNFIYRKNAYCVTSAVFIWPAALATFYSTYIMFKSHVHDDKFGPKSSKFRGKGEEASIDLSATEARPETLSAAN